MKLGMHSMTAESLESSVKHSQEGQLTSQKPRLESKQRVTATKRGRRIVELVHSYLERAGGRKGIRIAAACHAEVLVPFGLDALDDVCNQVRCEHQKQLGYYIPGSSSSPFSSSSSPPHGPHSKSRRTGTVGHQSLDCCDSFSSLMISSSCTYPRASQRRT